jgi:uncharacterized protein YkwD
MRYLFFLPLLVLVGWLVFNAPSNIEAPIVPTPTNSPDLNAEKLTALVNDWRVSQGLQPYSKDERLCVIARKRIKVGDDDHAGFLSNYNNYPYILAENSTWNAPTEKAALESWLHSPTHLSILKRPFKYACIATQEYNALQIFSSF